MNTLKLDWTDLGWLSYKNTDKQQTLTWKLAWSEQTQNLSREEIVLHNYKDSTELRRIIVLAYTTMYSEHLVWNGDTQEDIEMEETYLLYMYISMNWSE